MKLHSINQENKTAIIDHQEQLIEVEYNDSTGNVWLTNESCAMVENEGLNVIIVRELIRDHILRLNIDAALEGFEIDSVNKYSAYEIDVSDLQEADIYEIHNRFKIDDPSGCIQHASKKLLLAGKRTGGKPKNKDIQEAVDTLIRWLQLNQ